MISVKEMPWLALLKKAQVRYQDKNYAEAIVLCEKAIKLKDNEERLYTLKAMCHLAMGEINLSRRDSTKAIQLNPTYGKSYFVLGRCFVKEGKPEQARIIYESGLKKLKPTDEYHKELTRRLNEVKTMIPKFKKQKTAHSANKPDLFSCLNLDVILMIFEHLDLKDLVRMTAVSKRWRNYLTASPIFWYHLDLSPFCKKVNDSVLSRLMGYANNQVRVLNLSLCKKISLKAIYNCINLGGETMRELNLSCLDCLKDDLRVNSIVKFPHMHTIDVSYSKINYQNVGLLLFKTSDKLKSFYFQGCSKLSEAKNFSKTLKFGLSQRQSKLNIENLGISVFHNDPSTFNVIWEALKGDNENSSEAKLKKISLDAPSDQLLLLSIFERLQSTTQVEEAEFPTPLKEVGILHPSILNFAQSNTGMKSFKAGGPYFSSQNVHDMCSYWKNLTTLSLRDASVDDDLLMLLGSMCENLEYVFFHDCLRVTDVDDDLLMLLGSMCENLEYVFFHDCLRVTDVGVVALVSKKLPLKSIDLSFNYSITDDSLRAIGLHCPQLEYFIGTACSKITSSGPEKASQLKKPYSKSVLKGYQ
ncbi:hypothetical protein MP638_004594 [Amoeboaphelidium occidentale]|nr:hypothetical protein MP638_004594 [Amoeboaphelidium occidentale]